MHKTIRKSSTLRALIILFDKLLWTSDLQRTKEIQIKLKEN